MNNTYRAECAYWLAKHAHAGHKYGEHDYFEYHVLGVAAFFSDPYLGARYCEDTYIVALLHDVCEDTKFNFAAIYALFGTLVGDAVVKITRLNGEAYDSYIHFLKSNDIAKAVKIADLNFNLSQPNSKNKEKYEKALSYLEAI